MNELYVTAEKIVRDYLKITNTRKVLILKEDDNLIVNAFENVCKNHKINFLVFQLNTPRGNSSPIPEALEELKKSDYVIAPTKHSVTHSNEIREVVKCGKKVVTLPSITEEVFIKIKDSDFKGIDKLNKKIIDFFKGTSFVEISTPSGTQISFSIQDRSWHGNDDKSSGFVGNLPTGEAFCAPIENSAEGIIYMDFWKDKISPKDKAWIKIKNGHIVEWNSAAEIFVEKHSIKNGLIIAEFGIGTNKSHKKPIGNTLHDEKIYGTCHIAFGQNLSFGGKNASDIHSDIILLKPNITANGKRLIL